MEEVGRGVDAIDSDKGRGRGNAVTFTSGAGAIEGGGIVPGVVGTVEEVLDDLVGSGDIELVNIVKLGPRGGGEVLRLWTATLRTAGPFPRTTKVWDCQIAKIR